MASADATFFYNSMLAKALVQFLPPYEKAPLRLWFDKLVYLRNNEKELEIRDEYMWFILMMLQCQKIREPFNRPPPSEIGPLRDLVAPKIYEEILVANNDTSFRSGAYLDETTTKIIPQKIETLAPSNFVKDQPVPKEGIICYLAAFSDQQN